MSGGDFFTYSRSDIDDVTTELSITVPNDEMNRRIDLEIKKLQPQVTIKGFRKGKAPLNLISRMHGPRTRLEVSQRLISESLYHALDKEKIESTIGEPDINFDEFGEGKDFVFKAVVFLPPRPTVVGYESFTVEIDDSSVTDADVDAGIDEYRSAHGTFTKIEDRTEAQVGDVIRGTIRVALDDDPAGEPEPLVVKLGDGRLSDELEAGLIGAEVGKEKVISAVIPEDHREESLRGKTAYYTVVINELQQQNLPEVTDDFVKTLGLGVETVLELRLKVREQLEKQREVEDQTEIHAQILKQLLESNQFNVPQNMIDGEIRALLVRNGIVDPKKMDVGRLPVQAFREQLGKLAEERVRTTIIVDRIVDQEGITFGDVDIREVLEKISQEHGVPVSDVEQVLLGQGRKEGFIREHQQKRALDLLRGRAKVNKVKKAKESKG